MEGRRGQCTILKGSSAAAPHSNGFQVIIQCCQMAATAVAAAAAPAASPIIATMTTSTEVDVDQDTARRSADSRCTGDNKWPSHICTKGIHCSARRKATFPMATSGIRADAPPV